MAKAKSPKSNDNEAVLKTMQPNAPASPADETQANFSPTTSTTKAESIKPKATKGRTAKAATEPASSGPTPAPTSSAPTSATSSSAASNPTTSSTTSSSAASSPVTSSPAPRLEAIPGEGRSNGEIRPNGEAHTRTEARSDVRRNVVPINLDDEIRKVAYLLSERRGFAPGHEREDWLAAEREVRERYRQHTTQQTA